nr:transporter substrate-binding domain-containing protein [uncultured Carboxylicivirga sp.]
MFPKKVIIVFSLLVSILTFGQDEKTNIAFSPEETLWLQNNLHKMRYAPNPTWAPGDYIDENGVHQGIISDYIKIFEDELNVDFIRVYYKDWKEMYSGLLNDEIDFLGAMQVTEERKDYFAFTEPVLNIPIVLLINKTKTFDFSDHDLNGMKISVMRDYITQDYLTENYTNFELVECSDELEALIKTSLGSTDATIVDIMTASFIVEKYGITNLSIGTELEFVWHLSFAFRKEHETFAHIIDKILLTIDENQRRQIFNKWVSIPFIPKQNFFQRNYKVFIVSLIVFLIALFIFLFYSIVLRQMVRRKTLELKKELRAKKEAIIQSQKNEARLESLVELSKIKTDKSKVFLDHALYEIVRLTESNFGLLYKFDTKNNIFFLSNKLDLNNSSIEVKETFPYKNLDHCIKRATNLHMNTCSSCNLSNSHQCPITPHKFEHTLIFPIFEDDAIEAVLYLTSNKAYDEKDSHQIVQLVSAIWKLLSKQKWQEELIIAKAKAEESDKLKSSFLENLSHEIRTPMNGIIGFTELLNSPELSIEDAQYYTNVIRNSAYYLLSIITDIIEISKIDSGLVKPNKDIFSLSDFFDNILINSRNLLADKPLNIIIDNCKNGDLSIQSDELKLKQVIINLVSNAIKYTDEGSITIKHEINNNQLKIRVQDTGIGIAPEYQKVIFERFRQGDAKLAALKGGTGLGLSISDLYIKMLGGTIKLDSEIGKGSVFTIDIPVEVIDPNK